MYSVLEVSETGGLLSIFECMRKKERIWKKERKNLNERKKERIWIKERKNLKERKTERIWKQERKKERKKEFEWKKERKKEFEWMEPKKKVLKSCLLNKVRIFIKLRVILKISSQYNHAQLFLWIICYLFNFSFSTRDLSNQRLQFISQNSFNGLRQIRVL